MLYQIAEVNLDKFAAAVAKLNRKAVKIGCEPITFTTMPGQLMRQWIVRSNDANGEFDAGIEWLPVDVTEAEGMRSTSTLRQMVQVDLSSVAPVMVNGYTFVAALTQLDQGENEEPVNLIRCAPGQELPEAFRTHAMKCDHCNAARRRKEVFVIRHEGGEYKVVGRQCLKDFLGYNDVESMVKRMEFHLEIVSLCEDSERESMGGGCRSDASRLFEVITTTLQAIAADGWTSATKAREFGNEGAATSATVCLLLFSRRLTKEQEARYVTDNVHFVQADAEAKATAAIEWASELTEDNNYLQNLRAIARAGYVPSKAMGLACSLVVAFDRELAKRAEKAARPESHHVGTIGKRLTLTVTVVSIIVTEGGYGTTGIHKMTDENGSDLVWFASGSAGWLKEGHSYKVKATPKSHGEFRDRKQTVVSRVAVVEEIVAEEKEAAAVA